MTDRRTLGLLALLLAASCVPPEVAGGTTVALTAPQAIPGTAGPALSLSQIAAALPGPVRSPFPIDGAPLLSAIPAAPFVDVAQGPDAARALECLTAAVYYEARSEPIDGQRAVAQVVLNRVRSAAFPNSVCGVVYQGSERRTGCQFSFTCDGSLLLRREPAAWETARGVAQAALAGSVYEPVGSATYYHTTAILPWWAQSLSRVATIGAHIFYRWAGRFGDPSAFRQTYAGSEPSDFASGASGFGTGVADTAPFRLTSAGVTIHRGITDAPTPAEGKDAPSAAPAPAPVPVRVAASSGVRIHSGDATTASAPMVAGIRIHVGTAADAPDPG